jgi:hypothetical protein
MQIPANIHFDESKLLNVLPVKLFWFATILTVVCAMAYGVAYWQLNNSLVELKKEQQAIKNVVVMIIEHGPENVKLVPPQPDSKF